MGVQIAAGLDEAIRNVANLTSTDSGLVDRFIIALEKFKQAENALGTAALASTGTTAGNVPVLGSTGKLAASVINSTATGGSATDAGKLVALGSAGTIAAAMISGGGGSGGGLKHFSFFNGNAGPPGYASRDVGRQYVFDLNGNVDNRWTKPNDVTSILVIATGGGGSGGPGPNNTGDNPDGSNNAVPGWQARKSGGGAGGSTVFRFINNPAAKYEVKIGKGGLVFRFTDTASSTNHGGGSTQFGTILTAQGGSFGEKSGNGGQPRSATPGSSRDGEGILGGQGGDGSADRWGGGHGGGSFWGGGYSGGGGFGTNPLQAGESGAAPGAGGGAANGTNKSPPYGFTPRADGHPGNHGCVLILGW